MLQKVWYLQLQQLSDFACNPCMNSNGRFTLTVSIHGACPVQLNAKKTVSMWWTARQLAKSGGISAGQMCAWPVLYALENKTHGLTTDL